MVTLLLAQISQTQWMDVLGIILVVLEVIIVVIKFLQYLVPADSKFGVFLSKLLKGIHFVKSSIPKDKKDEDSDSTTGTTE